MGWQGNTAILGSPRANPTCRWVLGLILALLTALVAFFVNLCVENIAGLRFFRAPPTAHSRDRNPDRFDATLHVMQVNYFAAFLVTRFSLIDHLLRLLLRCSLSYPCCLLLQHVQSQSTSPQQQLVQGYQMSRCHA